MEYDTKGQLTKKGKYKKGKLRGKLYQYSNGTTDIQKYNWKGEIKMPKEKEYKR